MKHPVKVSVIIPVYNVEAYLPYAMQSCIDQTLCDVEFICVNDGSTDNSLEILNRYAKLDDRIVVIDKPNGGLSSARNAGMRVSNGEIIMFLDSDDYLSPNACERVWIESLEANTDIIVFGTEIVPANPRPSEWYNWNLHIGSRRFTEFDAKILFYETGSMPFVWRQAFSKRLLDKAGVTFDETVKFGEDTVFQMEIFPYAKNIAYIADRLYNYRWCREGSLMAEINKKEESKLAEHLVIADKIFSFWKEKDIFSKYGVYPLAWFIDFAGWHILKSESKGNESLQRGFVRIVEKYNLAENKKDLDARQKKLFKEIMAIK